MPKLIDCIEPAQILCVGDSRSDIVAARAAGCHVVAGDYGYHHDLPLAELRPDGRVRPRSGMRVLRAIA